MSVVFSDGSSPADRWPRMPLAEIAEVFTDGNWIESKDQAQSGIRLVQTGNVGVGVFKDRRDKARFIDEETFRRLNCFEVLPGDVLVSRLPDPVGRACIIPVTGDKMITAVDCSIIRTDDAVIDTDFLVYYTQTTEYLQAVDAHCTGTTRRRISRKNLGKVAVPVPPIGEQKRIVAVLDQAFAALDRARNAVEENLLDARNFFLSALQSVFSNSAQTWGSQKPPIPGSPVSTTKPEKRSKPNTRTGGRAATTRSIPGDYSLSVLAPDVAPRPGWAWSPLSALARLETGHTPSRRKPEYWGGDIGWIGIKEARSHHGKTLNDTREHTNELGIANSSARILPKDTVCLSRTASVGYVVKMGQPMATSQDFVNWVCGDQLEPDFLLFLLLAQGEGIRRFASGSVHQTIYFPEAKAFHICHPTRAVQDQICGALKAIFAEAAMLEPRYQTKIIELDELKESLLVKAFSGELK